MTPINTKYIINTKVAIKNGLTLKDIITETEKFFNTKYHQHYSDWDYREYPYLTMGATSNITGTRENGFLDYIEDGRIPIDWYQLSSETKQIPRPIELNELMEAFSNNQEFKEELL